jgi:hypothetical protein
MLCLEGPVLDARRRHLLPRTNVSRANHLAAPTFHLPSHITPHIALAGRIQFYRAQDRCRVIAF